MNNNKTKLPDLIVFVGFIFIIGFVSFLSLSKVDLLALKQSTKYKVFFRGKERSK